MSPQHRLVVALWLSALPVAACAAYVSPWPGTAPPGSRQLADSGHFEELPPPEPSSQPVPAGSNPTPRQIRDFERADFQRRFDAAADPRTHRLSLQRARDAGWGYVVEHFADMDRHRDGLLDFAEVWDYFDLHRRQRPGMAGAASAAPRVFSRRGRPSPATAAC